MTRDETIWLAGLLEGEGSFSRSGSGSPDLKLEMTDEDVVDRAATLLGALQVARRVKRSEAEQDTYVARVSGERAKVIMRAVYRFMGTRRQAKIIEILGRVPDQVPA